MRYLKFNGFKIECSFNFILPTYDLVSKVSEEEKYQSPRENLRPVGGVS